MQRLRIALVPILLTATACVHEAARPPQASAEPAEVPAPAPSPVITNAAPAEQPQAASSAPLPDASAPSTAAATPAGDGNSKSAAAPVPPRSPSTQAGPSATKTAPASAASTLHATQVPPATAAPNAAVPPSPSSPATAPALDLKALEQRLRDTHAIGVFTKLSLKNQVDDLLAQFKTFYRGQSQITLAQLRQKYEVLVMKAVSVLQDNDPQLASAISSSREAIWNVLADPKSFANI